MWLYILIYVLGYVLAYYFTRKLMWQECKDTLIDSWPTSYEAIITRLVVSIFSWLALVFILLLMLGNHMSSIKWGTKQGSKWL